METNEDRNLIVEDQIERKNESHLKTSSELNEKMSRILSDSQQTASVSDKPDIVQVKKAANQEDSNRSSTIKTISLVNCHCSCHNDGKKDVVRYELIEEESKNDSKNEEVSSDLATVGSSGNQTLSSTISEHLEQAFLSTSNESKLNHAQSPSAAVSAQNLAAPTESQTMNVQKDESTASSRSIELSLDKLSQSKFCSKCGKLKTSWLFNEKTKTFETISEKSEEIENEMAILKEDLTLNLKSKSDETLKSLSIKTQTSIGHEADSENSTDHSFQDISNVSFIDMNAAPSDFEKSFHTARIDPISIKRDNDMIICQQECRMHCPKIREYNPPVEEQRVVTASDNLTKNVESIESIPASLVAEDTSRQEKMKELSEEKTKELPEENMEESTKEKKKESIKTVHIVDPATESKKEDEKEKKKEKSKQKEAPIIPPKVILSLIDIDMQNKDKSLREKSTQSPSFHATQQLVQEKLENTVEPISANVSAVDTAIESPKLYFVEDLQDELKSESKNARKSNNNQSTKSSPTSLIRRLSNSYEYYETK